MVESKSKVRLEEANVEYDDSSNEGIVVDGAETDGSKEPNDTKRRR